MKISYNWLKDYVTIKISPEKLAERLTMLGLEVVAQEKLSDDVIFEIEVTANRPDCLNYLGIAREIATATQQKLKIPRLIQKAKAPPGKFIQIQDKKGCPRYIGKIIQGVKVRPSPEWLQKKLKSVGLRPVNNIVDITNYLLMELGQPMHAFDLDKLSEKRIVVRRAKAGEKIVTIDAEERNLDSEILVIADAEKPVGIAGIMGGKDSEVTKGTKNVLLESAYFNPIIIRRGRRKLGIASEAAYRFERNVDMAMVGSAASRAINLMLELAGGKLVSVCDLKANKNQGAATKVLGLNSENISRLLGQKVTTSRVKSILTGLGLKVKAQGKDSLRVTIPGFRLDLKEEEDLIEEIARHVGFDQLSSTLPPIKINQIPGQKIRDLCALARRALVATGLSEVITYSLISKEGLKKINWQGSPPIEIKNPLSKDQEVMRPTVIPGLLTVMQNNLSHNIEEVKIFEVGKIYDGNKETVTLGIGLMGAKSKVVSLLDLKGSLEALFRKLQIGKAELHPAAQNFFVPGKSFAVSIANQGLGYLGEVLSSVANNFEFKHQKIFLAQLNLEGLLKSAKWERQFTPLINFPLIRRDISLIIKEEISSGQIVDLLKKGAGPWLINISLADQYGGEQIPVGHRGLTYCLEFQAPDRTLSDLEVNSIHGKLCDLLIQGLDAKIRR